MKPMKADKPAKKAGMQELIESLKAGANACYIDFANIPKDAPKIDSGSLAVNLAAGIGGFPIGGMVEIAGEFSSGKTTLALACAAEIQKNGGVVLFVDFEHAFDPYYAQSLGVDTTSYENGGKFVYLQPMTLEDGWNAIQKLVDTGEITLVIIDSVAAAVPRATVEGEAGISRIGLQAQLLSNEYNKLAGKCGRAGCTALLLNQIRTKIEQRGMQMIVSQDTTGGHALKHYCLMRLWMKIVGKIEGPVGDDGEKNFIANKVRFQFIKNKRGKPYTSGVLIIRYGIGIDNEMALLEMATELGIVDQKSSYFIFNMPDGEVKVNGKEAARERLVEDVVFRNAVAGAVRKALNPEA
jgi:recombination protein RecA